MRGRAQLRLAVPVVAAALLLTACQDEGAPAGGPTGKSGSTAAASESSSPSPTETPSASPTETPTGTEPAGGTAEHPAPLTAKTDLLDWRPVRGSTDDAVTRAVTAHGQWTLTASDARATLAGPRGQTTFSAAGRRVSDALIDEQYAVVVLQDKAEERPAVATVTDLATGKAFSLDGRTDVPTTNGGTWALGAGHVLHATMSKGSYCLASVDLASHASEIAWCAPKRHGFSDAHLGPGGTSVLSFDDGSPSCRTVGSLESGRLTPFPDVADCKGWDGLLVDDGAVWSVIPKEQQVETANFFARAGDQYYGLGQGASGSLTWCGDAAYFTRDPQTDGGPAELMRWTPQDGLTVAYQSPRGQAFLEDPRCGGRTLTVTALTSAGDEQVTADLS